MRVLLDENLHIEHQQNLTGLSFGVVVIKAPSNRMADLLPVVPDLLQATDAVRPGEVRRVGSAGRRRGEPDLAF